MKTFEKILHEAGADVDAPHITPELQNALAAACEAYVDGTLVYESELSLVRRWLSSLAPKRKKQFKTVRYEEGLRRRTYHKVAELQGCVN